MSDKIGIKIGVDGEREFKNTITEINKDMKILGSEMKLVSSQFDKNDNSVEALTARNNVLNKQIDEQKNKIDLLRSALKNAADSFGENDKRTKEWQIMLNNAEAELNDLNREVKNNKEAIANAKIVTEDETDALNKLGKESDNSSDKVSVFGDVLKANLASEAIKKGISLTVDGIKKIGSAAFSAAKESIESYADYEQLVGGVDKLFKNSADKVKTNASKAYKAAGLNANEYMENVTSFSASLISSLKGDTEKAVDYADMAIIDMADNANTYGTEIESIQNAYQGFAKQNYTMLDNLKLGYGGTKTEMQRLIADANKLKKANGEAANLTIDSYADVVEAIHTVQTEMGISGTTAKESSNTISGSVDSMKNAYHNLLIGISDENADVDSLVNNVVESIVGDGSGKGGVLNTVGPRIKTVIGGVGKLASAAIKESPQVINLGSELIGEILDGFSSSNINFDATLNEVTKSLSGAITSNGPKLAEVGVNLFSSVVGDTLSLTATIVETLPEITDGFVEGLTDQDNIDKMVDGGIELAGSVVENTPKITSKLIRAIPKIIDGLFNSFTSDDSKGEMEDAGTELGGSLLKGILLAIPNTITDIFTDGQYSNLGEYVGDYARTMNAYEAYNTFAKTGSLDGLQESQIQTLRDFLAWAKENGRNTNGEAFLDFVAIEQGLSRFVVGYSYSAGEIMKNGEVVKTVNDEMADSAEEASNRMSEAEKDKTDKQSEEHSKQIENEKSTSQKMKSWNDKMLSNIIKTNDEQFSKITEQSKNAGKQSVGGYAEGIKSNKWLLYDNVKETFGSVIDWVKGIFDIHSPSKVMAEIAKYNIDGYVFGNDKNKNKIRESMKGITDIITGQFSKIPTDFSTYITADINTRLSKPYVGYSGSSATPVFNNNITFGNVTINSDKDIAYVAEKVSDYIVADVMRKRGAYA